MTPSLYYIYAYFDLDGTPRYIGLSKDERRMRGHLKRSSNRRLNFKIKALQREGIEMPHRVLLSGLTRDQAVEAEIAYISWYGREGCGNGTLWNVLAGGDGSFDPTPEMRAAKSRQALAYFSEHPEARQAQSVRTNAYWADPENRAKQSDLKKLQSTPALRARMSAAHLGVPVQNAGTFKKGQVAWNVGLPASAAARARMAAAHEGQAVWNKGKKASPEARANQSMAHILRNILKPFGKFVPQNTHCRAHRLGALTTCAVSYAADGVTT